MESTSLSAASWTSPRHPPAETDYDNAADLIDLVRMMGLWRLSAVVLQSLCVCVAPRVSIRVMKIDNRVGRQRK